MSEQKKPQAGEWWVSKVGKDIMHIVGTKSDGTIVWEYNEGFVSCEEIDILDWHHEPCCTGFDWTPLAEPEEAFPQWWTSNSTDPDIACVRRDSIKTYFIIYKNGRQVASAWEWAAIDDKERTRLTEAEALERLDWVEITKTQLVRLWATKPMVQDQVDNVLMTFDIDLSDRMIEIKTPGGFYVEIPSEK